MVSRLSFGTASLHRLFSAKSRMRILETALENGITHYDTSPFYGFGVGECVLGAFARRHPGQLTVTSKIGLYPRQALGFSRSHIWIRKAIGKLIRELNRPIVNWSISMAAISLEQSLRRLGRDTLDLLMLHEPIQGLFNADEFVTWLESARSAGKIRHWGVAGEIRGSLPWIEERHPLAAIVQTRDSIDLREADALLKVGRALQFTYGYLAAARQRGAGVSIDEVLRLALARNNTGSIIVSSCDDVHLQRLARVAFA